jgi:hypothetical protein
MAEKKPFVLRIDSETMKAIEKWAADEFRSTNGQIEWIINESLRKAGRLKEKAAPKTDKK